MTTENEVDQLIEEEKKPWTELTNEELEGPPTILLYGASGSGKTYLSGQFPNNLILACDPGPTGGAKSALLAHERLELKWDKPKIVKVTSYDQLMNLIPQLDPYAHREGGFDTITADSISYLQRIVMTNLLSKTGRETPRFEEWGLCVERMRNIINRLADFKCTTILTAVEQTQKDEYTQRIMGTPDLPGRLARELPQACDVVLRLYTVSSLDPSTGQDIIKYRFQSTPDDTWMARDRTGILPPRGDSNLESFKELLKLTL